MNDTPGVEVTTGPLGQGVANAVGLAMAEAHLAATFNRNETICDHYTYCLAGDGDLMEGVASEACSLAGHLKLGKLIVFYDDNHVTLAGPSSVSFDEDVEEAVPGPPTAGGRMRVDARARQRRCGASIKAIVEAQASARTRRR